MPIHNERCKDCKRRVLELLQTLYPDVVVNYDLNLPCKLDDYKAFPVFDSLALIHGKLQKYRGFLSFVRSKKLPKVDYYVPSRKLVVEFDESQHFTMPREITLKGYPVNLALGFPKSKWIDLTQKIE